MTYIILTSIVALLYWRTWNYKYTPDDVVPRKDYLYVVPQTFSPTFHWNAPKPRVRIWCITNHCINVAFVNYLFGWQPALLFAIHPHAVEEVCWVTGNYYAGTATLVLASYLCISHGWIGVAPALMFYAAAINSTSTAYGYPLFFLLTSNLTGMLTFLPWIPYFLGNRWTAGFKKRKDLRKHPYDKIEPKKIALMTKVVAEYIWMALVPSKISLFRSFGDHWGRDKAYYDRDCRFNGLFWASLALILTILSVGWLTNWSAAMWFFCLIAPHSMFKIYGQTTRCDRYLYLPLIGMCVLVAPLLPTPIFWMAVGYMVYRTHIQIPTWKDWASVYKGSMDNFPERVLVGADYGQEVMRTYVQTRKDVNRVYEAAYYIQKSKQMSEALGQPCFEIYMNMAFLCDTTNKVKEGLEFTTKAIELAKVQMAGDKIVNDLIEQEKRFKLVLNGKVKREFFKIHDA